MREICFETKDWPRIGSQVLMPSGAFGRVKSYNFNESKVEVEYLNGIWTDKEIREGENCVILNPKLLVKLEE